MVTFTSGASSALCIEFTELIEFSVRANVSVAVPWPFASGTLSNNLPFRIEVIFPLAMPHCLSHCFDHGKMVQSQVSAAITFTHVTARTAANTIARMSPPQYSLEKIHHVR